MLALHTAWWAASLKHTLSVPTNPSKCEQPRFPLSLPHFAGGVGGIAALKALKDASFVPYNKLKVLNPNAAPPCLQAWWAASLP